MTTKNIVGLAREAVLLVAIYLIGKFVTQATHIPISGNVVGFALLAVLLATGVIPKIWFGKISSLLVKNMGLFFIPVAAGVIVIGENLHGAILSYVIIVVISTLFGLVASVFAMRACESIKRTKMADTSVSLAQESVSTS